MACKKSNPTFPDHSLRNKWTAPKVLPVISSEFLSISSYNVPAISSNFALGYCPKTSSKMFVGNYSTNNSMDPSNENFGDTAWKFFRRLFLSFLLEVS